MNETTSLLDEYRARLRAASADLPAEVRDDLLDDVESHLAELRATSPSPAATRDALARLGTPEQVAAAAYRELGGHLAEPAPAPVAWQPPPPAPARRGRVGALDITAVVLLLVGGLFPPVLGWVVGVVLLWASTTWTWREKLLGTLVVPGGLAAPALLSFLPFAAQSCVQMSETDPATGVETYGPQVCEGFALHPVVGVALMVLMVVGPVVVATVLLRRAAARATAGV